jgi:hypothetical protein
MTRAVSAGLQRYHRFGFRHVNHHAGQAEQAEWMPTRQGAAYRVPECRVGRTFGPACSSFVTHIADATHGQ